MGSDEKCNVRQKADFRSEFRTGLLMAKYSIRTIWKTAAIAAVVLAGLVAAAVGWHRYEHPYDTLEQERNALGLEINQVRSRIVPPKGTSKADVEKVFGSPADFSGGGMGPPFVINSLGKSGVNLHVGFEDSGERMLHDNATARRRGWSADSYFQTDRVESACTSEPLCQDNEVPELVSVEMEVSRRRTAVPRLRAALAEYADRLASAPWSHK